MLSGLIVYSKTDKDKNTWFIEKCINNLSKKGISLVFAYEDDALTHIENNHIDFVIYRARNYRVLETIEKQGIRTFNTSLVNKIANDKYLTSQFLKEHNISCVPSDLSFEHLSLPFVMKSVDGHGGQEVYLINRLEDINHYKKPNKKYIFQRFFKNSGDLRLYLLNKKVIGAVLRNNKQDFRSNFSLGGDAINYKPEQEIVDTAIKIAHLLNADYIGVDFLKTENGWLVNEIEDPVGARMLYKASGVDAVTLFTDYIYCALNNKSSF